MLWYKGWLETRFRLAFALGMMSLITIFQYSYRSAAQASNPKGAILGLLNISVPFLVVIVCGMLAGAGIATNPMGSVILGGDCRIGVLGAADCRNPGLRCFWR